MILPARQQLTFSTNSVQAQGVLRGQDRPEIYLGWIEGMRQGNRAAHCQLSLVYNDAVRTLLW